MQFQFSFSNPGIQNGNQLNTSYPTAYSAVPDDWHATGVNAVNVVNVNGVWLPMVFTDSVFTKNDATVPNQAGLLYVGKITLAPAVYAAASQATLANDGVVLSLLRGKNATTAPGSTLASFSFVPGAWSAPPTFSVFEFCFLGDGTGPLQLQLAPLRPGAGTFGGTVGAIVIE